MPGLSPAGERFARACHAQAGWLAAALGRRFAGRLTAHDIEDVTQAALLAVCRPRPAPPVTEADARRYLYVLGYRLAVDVTRRPRPCGDGRRAEAAVPAAVPRDDIGGWLVLTCGLSAAEGRWVLWALAGHPPATAPPAANLTRWRAVGRIRSAVAADPRLAARLFDALG